MHLHVREAVVKSFLGMGYEVYQFAFSQLS